MLDVPGVAREKGAGAVLPPMAKPGRPNRLTRPFGVILVSDADPLAEPSSALVPPSL